MLLLESVVGKLLSLYYHGPMTSNKKSFLIQCPWHEDQSPSCHIFKDTGVFRCWSCHGDSKGVGPYKGFQALGMPETEARLVFIKKGDFEEPIDFEAELPKFEDLEFEDEFTQELEIEAINDIIKNTLWLIERDPYADIPQLWKTKVYWESVRDSYIQWQEENTLVASRREWTKQDGDNGNYREILYETLMSKEFQETYQPSVVKLKFKEPEERLALHIGNGYFEVYLRQKPNSVLKVKSINQKSLTFKPGDLGSVYHPFGLKRWEILDACRGLFVTEGPYDCLRIHQHCFQNNLPFKAIALLGTPNTEEIFKILEKNALYKMFKNKIPLILAFDHDKAGMKATGTFLRLYEEFFNKVNIKGETISDYIKMLSYPLEISDPGDLPLKAFLKALEDLEEK